MLGRANINYVKPIGRIIYVNGECASHYFTHILFQNMIP